MQDLKSCGASMFVTGSMPMYRHDTSAPPGVEIRADSKESAFSFGTTIPQNFTGKTLWMI